LSSPSLADAQAKDLPLLACGAEIPDLPMTVLKHRLSHVERRGRAVDRAEPDAPSAEDRHQQP
jgi:hypothetical protein